MSKFQIDCLDLGPCIFTQNDINVRKIFAQQNSFFSQEKNLSTLLFSLVDFDAKSDKKEIMHS